MHELVATQTGTNVPAILMALVFVAIGRSASFYLSDLQRNKIEAEYNSRCYLAFLSYEISKLKEFRQYRQQLCDAWLLYTGEHFPITASYQMVMESDISKRDAIWSGICKSTTLAVSACHPDMVRVVSGRQRRNA